MDRANMQMQVLEQPKATASRRPGWFAAGGVVGAILAGVLISSKDSSEHAEAARRGEAPAPAA